MIAQGKRIQKAAWSATPARRKMSYGRVREIKKKEAHRLIFRKGEAEGGRSFKNGIRKSKMARGEQFEINSEGGWGRTGVETTGQGRSRQKGGTGLMIRAD